MTVHLLNPTKSSYLAVSGDALPTDGVRTGSLAYLTDTQAWKIFDGTAWQEYSGGRDGVTDHGALTGLADDDHPQYALRTDGPVFSRAMDFTETAGAGVYTATLVLPSSSVLVNMFVVNRALWTAGGSTATLNVRDTATANAYINGVTVHNSNFLTLNALDSWPHIGTGALNNVYPQVYYPSGTTITATITTTGAGGTIGRTTIIVLYTVPPVTNAAKV